MTTPTYEDFEKLSEQAREKIRCQMLAHINASRAMRPSDMTTAIMATLGGTLCACAQIIADLVEHHSLPREHVEQEMIKHFQLALKTTLNPNTPH
ncbi:hypothetical protein [Novosphingobium rosa]|uniref:hypothetical protein n=1 Tax=Novosphingobium rosa TaxID=76978 RepID=UPI000831A10B|nr:hypothetical protein [Novosphingobium rosa]